MALATYPLNDTDYSAEDAELFHCTRSSGIHAGDDFNYSITGADNNITIGIGIGWIRNSRFSGKVVALKSALTLDLGIADSINPRIDAVVIQFDANANKTEIVVKKGEASSAPVAPEVSRTEALYELHLYHVRREAGASAVSAVDITDLRTDETYCGLMAESVTPMETIPEHNHDEVYAKKNHDHSAEDVGALPSGGGAMTGAVTLKGIYLTENVDFGDAFPVEGLADGRLYFIAADSAAAAELGV